MMIKNLFIFLSLMFKRIWKFYSVEIYYLFRLDWRKRVLTILLPTFYSYEIWNILNIEHIKSFTWETLMFYVQSNFPNAQERNYMRGKIHQRLCDVNLI